MQKLPRAARSFAIPEVGRSTSPSQRRRRRVLRLRRGLTIDDMRSAPTAMAFSRVSRAHMAAPNGAAVLTFFKDHRAGCRCRCSMIAVIALTTGSSRRGQQFRSRPCRLGHCDQVLYAMTQQVASEHGFSPRGPERREDLPPTGPTETHPCVEEFFLLEGSLGWPQGMMRPGAYFWRPPVIEHGPGASLTGYLGLFRSREGPSDRLVDGRTAPTVRSRLHPTLPPFLAHHAAHPTRGRTPTNVAHAVVATFDLRGRR